MSADHTPGPFLSRDERETGSGIDIYSDMDSDNEKWVACVMGAHGGQKGFPTDAECAAHAALFIAAPDLLAALADLHACAGSHYYPSEQAHDKSQMALGKALRNARAALSKARGQA